MKQIVHIFRKDVRRHWLEILLSLATVAAFVWLEPRQWLPRDTLETRILEIVANSVEVVLVVSWGLLTARVVQGENLVGDRQFWVTRPYEWKKLLLAKLLFVIVFINAPLLVAQEVLLQRAGFGLTGSATWALIGMQIGVLAICILPITALATVTSGIGQLLMALLAIAAYIAAAVGIASYVPSEGFSSGSDAVQEGLFVGVCLLAVIWQYARRATTKTRVLLGAGAASILIVVVATPYRTLVARQYPPVSSVQTPIMLALELAKPALRDGPPDKEESVNIRFPLIVSGIAQNSLVGLDGTMVAIDSRDGLHWNSGWKAKSSLLFPDDRRLQLDFEMPKAFFETVRATPVKVSISLAVKVFRDNEKKRTTATEAEFAVPGVGQCAIQDALSNSLLCRFAIESPRLVVMETSSSEIRCRGLEDQPVPPGRVARGWDGKTDAGPISPIGTFGLSLWEWHDLPDSKATPRICPGTVLLFDRPELVRAVGVKVDIPGVILADYKLDNTPTFTFRPTR